MPDLSRGFWRLADPKISITSAASMAIGASLAADSDRFSWAWLLVLGVAMFCMEVAKNAWGDVIDFDSGTDLAVAPEDRTDFSGGKRVLVDELLTRSQTWAIAGGFTGAGLALGALMVFAREPALLPLGAAALFLGWSYHGPPLKLAYRGLGELDVVLIYGPAIAMATYVLMAGEYHSAVVWGSLPLGIFIAAFLWVNEFPDYLADRQCGKRNLVVVLGRHPASRVLPLIYLAGLSILAAAIARGALPAAAAWGGIAVLPAGAAALFTWREPETFHRHRPVQPLALLAFVLLSAGVSLGVLLG
ncbi:MAG: prenyltransferase [Halieaceae bacterium]|jgi:1,4-dihydroxy-2-naphthoate octaprenyltransferase|nr:prenyltransferase [Halieaceae bacterium]